MNKKFDINVRWEDDDNPDLSWLGEYKSSRPDTLYIDRKNDVLINPNVSLDKSFTDELEHNNFIDELEEKEIPYDDSEDEDDDEKLSWVVNYPYWEELSYSCRYDRNSYRYVESMNYQETTNEEEYRYFKEDVERLEDYGNYWNMRGCIVTASLNGVELGSGSLWGLESDMDNAQEKQFIEELTSEAIDEAKKNLSELHEIVVE